MATALTSRRTAAPRLTVATAVLSASVLAVFAFVGGWQRRWISDDGLIVLRTVRNLLAGNGPVFNAGERVETNTSTLWQYVIYLGGLLTGARLETIAMWAALLCTTAALLIAALATARLWGARGGLLIFVPAGGLVYLALPPARDFATSGLEWGLSLLYLAVLWALLVRWAEGARPAGRHRAPGVDWAVYLLAFWCGLSWLVRPELALYGGLVGILLLVAARSWKTAAGILAVALPVPLGYQIFRMGYYGLLTPHTAVAKSASDSMWGEGWGYVRDLADPYTLFLALAVLVGMAAALLWRVSARPADSAVTSSAGEARAGRMRVRSRTGVIALILAAAGLHILYVIRVGGDFMHGRMLLLPLFALLLPLMVVPVVDLSRRDSGLARWAPVAALGLGFFVLLWWTVATVDRGHEVDWQEYEEGELGVVDEREFWTNATRREPGDPPQTADDFLQAKVLGDFDDSVDEIMSRNGAMMVPIIVSSDPETYSWFTQPRQEQDTNLRALPPTLYLINLGMTGMHAPLDMRVLDTVGLSSPVGARQPRDPDGRVGHDKWLPYEWQIADTDADLDEVPAWYDREEALLARAALHTPEFVELFESYRAPLTAGRFFDNIGFALTTGRTLEFSLDPRDHLEESTVTAIEDYVRDTDAGRPAADVNAVVQPPDVEIAWPATIKTE